MPRNATVTHIRSAPRGVTQHAMSLETLPARYRAVRQATLALAAGLSAEDCALQSMPDASPVKWHLAHTSWFFETFVLEKALAGYSHFHPHYRMLFNSYYVGVGERHPRPERGLLSRPALEDILRYREHVDQGMQRVLGDADALPKNLRDLIELGMHHEQQHQELILTDLKHLFSRNALRPTFRERLGAEHGNDVARRAGSTSALQWIEGADGLHRIGHSEGDGEFTFDNELPSHRVFLEPHALGSRLVTNGEYQAFIEDGGYARPELWLSEGWDTLQAQRWQAPLYWEKRDGLSDASWQTFTLFGMEPLDAAEPVCHVSYFEADAYARWAGARLPYETEWEALAAPLNTEGNFVEKGSFRPLSAPAAATADPQQMFGDLWEWTHSTYAPYPGYSPAPGAVGEYNGKFMVNQYVLRGGSFATPHSHIRASYRNFFPAAARWQFMGIRLARSQA